MWWLSRDHMTIGALSLYADEAYLKSQQPCGVMSASLSLGRTPPLPGWDPPTPHPGQTPSRPNPPTWARIPSLYSSWHNLVTKLYHMMDGWGAWSLHWQSLGLFVRCAVVPCFHCLRCSSVCFMFVHMVRGPPHPIPWLFKLIELIQHLGELFCKWNVPSTLSK